MNQPAGRRESEIAEFLQEAGWEGARQAPLPGDASTRRYIRLIRNGQTALLMDQPQNAEAPAAPLEATAEERRALGYNAVARLAGPNCARFVAAATHLRGLGLTAPDIYAARAASGLLLIEDFGNDLYADMLTQGANERTLYEAAIDALVAMHRDPAPATIGPDTPLHAYDEVALLAETDLLTEWFLPMALKRPVGADEAAEHRALWRSVLKQTGERRYFVHRDYHAQNLFWLPKRSGAARVGLIDFQDGVAGSASYDFISLIEDARRDVPKELASAMTRHYLAQAEKAGLDVEEERFRAEAAIFAAQRNTKIVGIFARLAKRDGKLRYLDYLPRVWRYLENDLEHPALSSLKAWYDKHVPRDVRFQVSYGDAP